MIKGLKIGLYLSVKTYTIMKKTALLFIGLLLVMVSCQPSKDTQKTLLWKISGNGLHKPSYLFGTWHGDTQLRNQSFLDSIPFFYETLDSAEVFAGEAVSIKEAMDSTYIDYRKSLSREIRMPGDTLFKDLLNEEQIAKLDLFLRKKSGGRMTTANLNIKPIVAMYFMGQGMIEMKVRSNIQKKLKKLDVSDSLYSKKREQLLAEVDVMDRYLQKYSYTHQKKVVGLDELAGCNTSVLSQSGKTLKEEADSLMSFITKYDSADYVKSIEEQTAGLRQAYREQNIFKVYEEKGKQLQKLNDLNPGDSLALEKLMKGLLTDRNYNWMKVIPGIIKEKSAFIAVGAVHLGGEEGLINLLKKEGYTVEPIH